MRCEQWRETLSAQLDGEDDPTEREHADAHLAGCAGCRDWFEQAATVNRLTRTGLAAPIPDLSAAIVAALPAATAPLPPSRRARLVAVLYAALAGVGAVQLVLGLAQVGGGATGVHSHAGAGLTATAGHLWHESAAWNVAVGAGFLLVGLRRSRPTGLVPMLTAFVGMLLLLSVNDLATGRVDAERLVSHGFVLLGYGIVLALSRTVADPAGPGVGRRSDGPGWRARFEPAEEPAQAHASARRLRLLRNVPPTTACYRDAA